MTSGTGMVLGEIPMTGLVDGLHETPVPADRTPASAMHGRSQTSSASRVTRPEPRENAGRDGGLWAPTLR